MNAEWRKSAPPQLIQYRIVHDSMEWIDPEVWEYNISVQLSIFFKFEIYIFTFELQYQQIKPEGKIYGECKAILSKDKLIINKKKSNIAKVKLKYIRRVTSQNNTVKFSIKHHDEKTKHIITCDKATELAEKLLFLKDRDRLKKKALTIQGYKSQTRGQKLKKKRYSELSTIRVTRTKDENIVDLDPSERDQSINL